MKKQPKSVWGILSTANIAVNQVIPAMQKSNTLVVGAIASRNASHATEVAQTLGVGKAYGSYDELLADHEIDIIYNPLPNHLHVPWTLKALEAGKHVLCEKPIALSAEEAATLTEVSDRTGKKVREAFMVRHHPQWIRARELALNGTLGRVGAIHATFCYENHDPLNVRNRLDVGGGALNDVGCYAVAIGRDIFGCEPEKVVALVDRDPEFGTDRLTSAILAFPEGRRLIFTCATQLVRSQDVQIIGTKGRLSLAVPFNQAPNRGALLMIDDGTFVKGGALQIEELAPADQYMLQAEAFSEFCMGEDLEGADLADAVCNMHVIDALWRSEESEGWVTVKSG